MTIRRFLPAIAALIVIVGCASDGGDDGPPTAAIRTTPSTGTAGSPSTTETDATTRPPEPDATTESGATAETDATTGPGATMETDVNTTEPAPSVGEPVVSSELVGEFDQPVDLAVRPGDGALWIVQQGGTVVRFDDPDSTPAIDVSGRIDSGGERGLLGLVFDPTGAFAYLNFTDRDGDTVIAEYDVTTDGTFDAASERIVLTVDQPFGNHNAGDLAFGPDGMLYVPLGDGGSGGDPERNGSNPATLLGSLLRIDPSPGGDQPYSVPPDNPFADGESFAGVSGAPEVWAWGLRNPWKIAFDPVTADLWIPDVGQNEFEEINVVSPTDGVPAGRGADFGWSAFEGNERFDADVPDSGRTTPPVLTYSHSDGCSISGGVPYRGTAIAELAPAFVYSDYCTGTIWALDLLGSRNLTLLDGFSDVAAIRAGPDAELYVLERGAVHRLVPG